MIFQLLNIPTSYTSNHTEAMIVHLHFYQFIVKKIMLYQLSRAIKNYSSSIYKFYSNILNSNLKKIDFKKNIVKSKFPTVIQSN